HYLSPLYLHSYSDNQDLLSFPTRRSSDLCGQRDRGLDLVRARRPARSRAHPVGLRQSAAAGDRGLRQGGSLLLPVGRGGGTAGRSEEHTSELQSRFDLVCRLLLEKK